MDPLRLIGVWRFDRRIADGQGRRDYTVEGEAVFTRAEGGGIRWSETGMLHGEGVSTPIRRTLLLEPGRPGEAAWRVLFEDGRFFHSWQPGAVEHLCGLDTYLGEVAPPLGEAADASWSVRWLVTGPQKDYAMTTRYRSATARVVS
ncbi:MAG TPA: DUF6314 family protein [Gryllotalpicola sp.]